MLPDADGTVHGDLAAERVRALCDRRAGIGGDGVLRAVREGDGWFMDYRNADGSVSEMCGNGIRVFARYLHEREGEAFPMRILHPRRGEGPRPGRRRVHRRHGHAPRCWARRRCR